MQVELESLRCIVAALERRIIPVKLSNFSIQTDPKLSSTAAELDVAEKLKHLRAEFELESMNRRRSVDKLLRRASDLEKENRRLVGIIHQLRKNNLSTPSSSRPQSPTKRILPILPTSLSRPTTPTAAGGKRVTKERGESVFINPPSTPAPFHSATLKPSGGAGDELWT